MKGRLEKDALGRLQVPSHVYYGIFTTRALKNFQLTGLRAPRVFIKALGLIKEASAEINMDLGLLDKKLCRAIMQAAQEFADGKFDEEFPLDPIQAGAGTPFNMNANEVIANRANEILGEPLGSYNPVHPNNHVNLSQSSNDVIPTAARISALFAIAPLIDSLEKLAMSFHKISFAYSGLVKVGRTHLEDAVPVTIGQEFKAFATMLEKTKKRLILSSHELLEVGLGGTATGSGITTHPGYQKKVVMKLAKLTRLPLSATNDLFETTASMNLFVGVSGALKMLAIDLVKIANDLKILNMGPFAGIGEITLPKVQPGSSIMPGKVNPSVAEAVHMAGYQVMGADHAITLAAQAGQLQVNVMTPLIIHNLLSSILLLSNTCEMFRKDCVDGITINETVIKTLFERSLVTATALSPYLGYEVTAELVKEALETTRSIVYVLRQKGFIEEQDLRKILGTENTTKPAMLDMKLKSKIERNEEYQKFKKALKPE